MEDFSNLLVRRVVLVLSPDSQDHDGQRFVFRFQEDALVFDVEAGAHDVVHGDDGGIDVTEAARQLGGFDFLELEILRIIYDISRRSLETDAVLEL